MPGHSPVPGTADPDSPGLTEPQVPWRVSRWPELGPNPGSGTPPCSPLGHAALHGPTGPPVYWAQKGGREAVISEIFLRPLTKAGHPARQGTSPPCSERQAGLGHMVTRRLRLRACPAPTAQSRAQPCKVYVRESASSLESQARESLFKLVS